MYNPFSLEGKTILVTGASSGIGAATAIQCSRMGAKLVITARNRERLEKTFSEMEGEGHELFTADLTQETEIDQLVARLPALDGIVHCAGIGFSKVTKFINKEDIDKVFSSNIFAHVLISQKVLKMKKLKKASSVVFISSIASWSGSIGHSLYAATKGALNAFAKSLAHEVASQKIRVNNIQPGMVETPLINFSDISDDQFELDKKKNYPLGRYGLPEDIAYLIIYLLSDASQWMTGNIITIDGGFSIRH